MPLNRALPVVGGLVGIAALVAFAATPGMAATCATGSAYAISADASVLNSLHVDVPTLPVATYPQGANKSLLSLNLLGKDANLVKLNVLHVKSGIEGGKLRSHADLTDVSLLGLIRASVLNADCTADANGVDGHSDILNLQIAGKATTITANHPINLDAAGNLVGALTQNTITITFDEHIRDGSKLTVNALHVHIGDGLLTLLHLGNLVRTDIVLSQAVCAQGSVPSGPGGGTPPGSGSGTPTPTGGNGPTTTTSPAPTGGNGSTTTTSAPAVAKASNNSNLPFTGVAGVVPMVIGALVLLAAGGGTLFWAARRRRAAGGTSDS